MSKTIKLSQKELQQTFTLQHDHSDCGVACLLSLIQYYGGSNHLEKLRELSGTTKQGTTLLGLFQVNFYILQTIKFLLETIFS